MIHDDKDWRTDAYVQHFLVIVGRVLLVIGLIAALVFFVRCVPW